MVPALADLANGHRRHRGKLATAASLLDHWTGCPTNADMDELFLTCLAENDARLGNAGGAGERRVESEE